QHQLPGSRLYRLEELQPVDHPDWAKLVEVQRLGVDLIQRPWDAGWLTLMGGPGCGKTHLLRAAHGQLSHLAAYLYADAFADDLRQAISTNQVAELKDAAVNVPVLILDDLGTEYTGSEYIKS